MRQVLEIRGLPRSARSGIGWFGRLRTWLLGAGHQQKTIALQHCSDHLLRDIGLRDDRRANRLLRDDVLFRL